ncbi:hypothetical protein DOY81_006444 [Sarcophaga bullata]|nr:hypothetical protein DOY81_006444 [Sarcophaga bullata]
MSIPVWLTKNYIEEVLKIHHKDVTLKVKKFSIKPAFGKGENFGGFLTKVKVLYNFKNDQQQEEKHFICKTSYEEDEFAKEKLKDYDIFNREMSIYEQVLPKLNDLLKEIDDTDRLFPSVLHVDYKRQALIFEDLTVQGYVMANRIERLDMDHVKLVLRKLSKMHATSAVLNERNAGCLEKYDRGFFNKYTDTYKTFFVNNFMACARYLAQLNDADSRKYAEKIFAMSPHYMSIGRRCFTPIAGHVNVLAHGDVWTNNVMFKYCSKTRKPLDVLLIDFQYAFWGSPALDLHHFFNTSMKEPLRLYHQDELMQYFHKIFIDTLKKLKYKSNAIPSLKKFRLHAEQKRFFALHSAVVIQPVMLNEDPTDADYNSLMGEDERGINFKNRLYTNPTIQDNLKTLLPMFDRRGLLESANVSQQKKSRKKFKMCENSSWQAPSWLTDSYLEDVLRKYLKDGKIKIQSIDIKPATANGENYASVMSRIQVKFSSENKISNDLSFIMKYSYESDPFIANIMSGYDIYNTEMKMYDKILPQLADILLEVGDSEQLFAKTLKVDYNKSAILFEDLKVNNYILTDRLTGMDDNHARMVLKKLAKFHAAAAVLNQRLNGELEKFQRGIFNRHTRGFGCMFEYMTEVCAKFAKSCPELGPYYHDKLMKLKPHVVEYATRAYNSNPRHFYTLSHGDLWTNNIMMRYDDAKVLKDVLLIDFQFSNWCSPAVDLHYFLHTSLLSDLQLNIHALNKLIQYYHGVLTEMLKKLKYNDYIPTLHELHVQLEEGKFLAVTAALASQTIMINDQCDDADFHSLVDNDERSHNFRASAYKNKRVQKHIKYLLPYFDRCGLLDVQKEF